MTLKLITGPAATAVTLAEAKLHCKIDASLEDTWITAAIKAATLAAEHETGRRFVHQTWEAVYDAFPAGGVELGTAPVDSITSVKYLDGNGSEQTLDPSQYVLDRDQLPCWVLPASGLAWPSTAASVNAVRVRFVAGYGPDDTTVPENAKLWILMHVGTAYKHRESIATGVSVAALVNRFHDALLDPLRIWRL